MQYGIISLIKWRNLPNEEPWIEYSTALERELDYYRLIAHGVDAASLEMPPEAGGLPSLPSLPGVSLSQVFAALTHGGTVSALAVLSFLLTAIALLLSVLSITPSTSDILARSATKLAVVSLLASCALVVALWAEAFF